MTTSNIYYRAFSELTFCKIRDFAKNYTLDIWQGPECAYEYIYLNLEKNISC